MALKINTMHTPLVSLKLRHVQADVILAVTCAIRDNAERKIWTHLDYYCSLKKKRA